MNIEFHPVAEIFPLIDDDRLAELAKDISENGLREPIWITKENKIIDGRNRYLACEMACVEPKFRNYEGDESKLVEFVVSLNLHRRHLDESARSIVAGKIETLRQGRPIKDANLHVLSRQAAADMLNVSPRSVASARKVLDDGVPELVEAVERGEIAVSRAAKIAELPPEEQRHFRTQFTGENEWYTPPDFIERARAVLGEIELDAASSEAAQAVVRASKFYTKEDDALSRQWRGKVWLNPPYAQPLISQFMDKICEEVSSGRVPEAIALTHNYTDTTWFHKTANTASAICFTRGRVKFVSPSGQVAAPTQGQAFFYFGPRVSDFKREFAAVGFVVEVLR